MTALQIYLIRHAETAWSLSGQHTGITDLPLTSNGEAMASKLTYALQNIPFALVSTSPRLRARSTCELAGLGGEAQVEPDLAEWDYGDFEGLRTIEIRRQYPDWDIWTDGCPQGETAAQVSARADRLITRLLTLTGKVALFSHGQFAQALAARWIGLPILQGQHFLLDTASISILSFQINHAQRRVIALWNASTHYMPLQ